MPGPVSPRARRVRTARGTDGAYGPPELRGPLEPESTRPGDAPAVPGPAGARPGAPRSGGRRLHPRPRRAQRGSARPVPRRTADRPRPGQGGAAPCPASGWPRTGDRATLVHAVYDELPEVLHRLGIARVQGVLFDLGVSSMQLDEADRGFAYAQDAPLDMRMDQTTGISAAEVLNTYPAGELVRILRAYGEEKQAKRIVAAIVREREKEPFSNSARLVELIRARAAAGRQAHRRQSGQAHLPGAAHRGQRRTVRPGAGDPGRREGAGRRRADRRAVVPLARGPARQAGVRGRGPPPPRRPGCPSPERYQPRLGCPPVVPNFPPRKRSRRTAGPRRPGCGGAGASGGRRVSDTGRRVSRAYRGSGCSHAPGEQ